MELQWARNYSMKKEMWNNGTIAVIIKDNITM